MAKPNEKAPVSQGGRFAALKARLARKGDAKDAGAVAAVAGRKKYGKKQLAMMARAGRE